MNMEQRRERHNRFWMPPEKGEGCWLSVSSPIDDSGDSPAPLVAIF